MRERLRWVLGGGLMSGGVFLGSVYVPFIGILMPFASALPLILVVGRSWLEGGAALMVGTAMVWVLGGWVQAGVYLSVGGVLAFSLSGFARLGWGAGRVISASAAMVLILLGGFLLGVTSWHGKNLLELVRGSLTAVEEGARRSGLLRAEQAAAWREGIRFLLHHAGAIAVVVTGIGAAITYGLAVRLFARVRPGGLPWPHPRPFDQWRPPEPLVFGLLLGVGLYLAGRIKFDGIWTILGGNFALVFLVLYAGSGLALIRFFCGRLGAGWMLTAAACAVAVVQPVIPTVLGVTDVWVNFRSRAAAVPPKSGNDDERGPLEGEP